DDRGVELPRIGRWPRLELLRRYQARIGRGPRGDLLVLRRCAGRGDGTRDAGDADYPPQACTDAMSIASFGVRAGSYSGHRPGADIDVMVPEWTSGHARSNPESTQKPTPRFSRGCDQCVDDVQSTASLRGQEEGRAVTLRRASLRGDLLRANQRAPFLGVALQ